MLVWWLMKVFDQTLDEEAKVEVRYSKVEYCWDLNQGPVYYTGAHRMKGMGL